MTIFATFLGVAILLLTFTLCLKLVISLLKDLHQQTSDTVVSTVVQAMKGIFGGTEPATQLPGNTETEQPKEPFFPPWEEDELGIPGSGEEIRGQEAGWAPSRTDLPPDAS